MDNFQILRRKLEAFIRKFYLNELLKGVIFFIAIGLLYFLFTLLLEYFLWLGSTGRTILFWSFIAVETFLFGRFLVYPLLKLFRISKGIDFTEASRIIGRHFPEVSDKLLNLLQLSNNSKRTDLLIASIEQKSQELRPVPFSTAVDFRKNLPYLKYAAIPVVIILIVAISGRLDIFSGSYERVVNYKTAYEPPAPFSFQVHNTTLKVQENEDLTIQVSTSGRVVPQDVSVHYNGETYYMNKISPGSFVYSFEPARESFEFSLSANNVDSRKYEVEVIKVPKMRNLRMILEYPAHTFLGGETIEGTGNATVPEGTQIHWELQTSATERVAMKQPDTLLLFKREGETFKLQQQVKSMLVYEISTSNNQVQHFERLNYQIRTVADELPELILENQLDSVDGRNHYFYGKVTDDYGIRAVRMIIEAMDSAEDQKIIPIAFGKGNVGEFVSSFPDTLDLQKGMDYQFFFEVIDNDALNGYKRVRSQLFTYRERTEAEEKQQRLQEQREAINGMDGSLEEMKLSEKELEELSRLKKEKEKLNYNDRKRLENFLDRQKQQNKLMENFTEKLKRNLQEESSPQNEEFKEELEKRLSNREEEIQENEKLLEELEKYSEKIQEEGLREKLEELSKNSRNQERSLEQLLELTKKYYVQEKAAQLSRELDELGKKQEEMAGAEEKTGDKVEEEQKAISDETEKVFEELERLQEENEGLKKPQDIPFNPEEQEEVKSQQEKAEKELEQENKEGAKKHQQKAGEKLQEMAQKMQQQMQQGGMEQMQEDASMLRQILDNLVTFSFGQEDLMEEFKKLGGNNSRFPGKLRRQDQLRENFRHVDDSLYALAMRNEMISEKIAKELIDVEYNLEQVLERLGQGDIRAGIGSQQYVVTGANDLAYLLSRILGSMEDMLSGASGSGKGKGQGGGKGDQLPDIIKKQGELNEQMMQELEQGKGRQEERGGQGEGLNGEKESEALFRIFQEQQMLRRALEEELKKEGMDPAGNGVKREMEQIEKKLLEKGFDPQTLQRMQRLEHRLLELEEAQKQQGQKPERESSTSKDSFENETKAAKERIKEYFNTTEILNRQSLPLRPIYKSKVKEYFERRDN
ncbi:hypothetical protein [Salinimicrobium oceani]|uniref:DUF4175 family protein n=1 Tax=Salinimicrobium oceani TaxID=2722702 RepID=A0ABX1CXU3_9FLAO|nr:hypothetical protein [Salinimicrobium oceani]NJW51977.1 hypothetical protein [Salinimicrobium oceani]